MTQRLSGSDPSVRPIIARAAGLLGLDMIVALESGSRLTGTATPESDHDVVGVYVESDDQVYGLEEAETTKHRLVRLDELSPEQLSGDDHPPVLVLGESEDPASLWLRRFGVGGKDPRALPTDVEFVSHPLRKFVSLAAAGNPSVLCSLWTPLDGASGLAYRVEPAFELLVEGRGAFLSKKAGYRHAGYARAQRDALLGLTRKRTNRPELVAEHGFDSKYGANIIRLLFAGLDLVRTGGFELPMSHEHTAFVREIREGRVPLDEVLSLSRRLESELEDLTDRSSLPEHADRSTINRILKEARHTHVARS